MTAPKLTKPQMRALVKKADAAGKAAAAATRPTPMRVVQRANPLDDRSPVVKDYGVYNDGVCGFATIQLKPANSSFANWLKANDGWRRDSYLGGIYKSVWDYRQSYELKGAYARAYAGVLRDAGFDAYSTSRMD